MGVRKALNDFYKGLVKSADKSKKGGGKSTQRKKKRESSPQKSTQKSNGTRGTGVSRNTSSSSGESSRPSSNNRPSTSSNKSQTKSSSPATQKRGSGAIGPATKAGVMGGNTSSKKSTTQFKVGGKTIGPVTKAGVMGASSSGKTTVKGQAKEIKTAGKVVAGTAKYTAQRWAGYATKAAGAASKQAYNKQNTGRKAGQTTPTRGMDRANAGQKNAIEKRKDQKAKIAERNNSEEFKKGREEYTKPFRTATKKIEQAKERTLEKATEDFSDKKKYKAPKWAQKFVGDKEFSAKDIAKGGIEMSSEMVDYMIPYVGTSGKFIKGAEKAVKAVKGGKMLTQTAKTGAKELTKDGQKAVSEIAARMVKEGKAPNEAIKAATKKVMRSDRATNIQKELLANAMQDATIGTTLDAAKGKEQGLEGKEFRNYMLQNAAMNAVFGGAASGVAGRTTRAGKKAIKTGIADSINKGSNLSPSEAKEFINLQYIKDSAKGNVNLKGGTSASGLSKEQQTRYNDLLKKSQNTDEVVKVNDKGKIVAINKDATNVLSPSQKKEYFNLKAQNKAGTITPNNKVRLQRLDAEVKTAQRTVDSNANKVLGMGGKNVDRGTLELTVKHFENTGETTKLKKAQSLLDKAIKSETKKAVDIAKTSDSNVRLSDIDVDDYISSGNSKAVHKKAKTDNNSNILRTDKDIANYVEESISSNNKDIRPYGVAGNRFVGDVSKKTNGDVDLSGKYLEIPSEKVRHSYNDHHVAKEKGDLDLSLDDYKKIPEYIDTYDEIIETVDTSNGLRLVLAKKVNGYTIITEMVSEGRNSIKFNNMWKVTTKKFLEEKRRSLPYLGLLKESNGHQSAAQRPSNSSVSAKPAESKPQKEQIDASNAGKQVKETPSTKAEPNPAAAEARVEDSPENPLFREWKDLDAELKDLNTKEFTPDAEKRSDEIISRINEISEELGGGRVTKENADEALRAIEAQRASDETLIKNNEDVIKNSDDELAGTERPTPDSAEMPKDLKANKKASRPIKDDVQDALNRTDGEYTFKASEKKEIDESFDRISNRIANGDDAGAKADAEELVEKHFHFDAEEKEPNTGYKEKRKELKDLQKYLRSRAWEMPEGSARTLDEFLEAIGLPKNATRDLPIRKWSHKDNVMGKKGAHRDVIFKGGKLPRAQIDDEWAALCREYPDYFKPEDAGSTEKQFQALAEAAMYDLKSIPEFNVRKLDDAEIKDWKESKVDEILDLARKNAGTYKGIDEPTPLKPIDDMTPAQLEKHLDSEKNFHLKRAIEKHGEDSPRVKEIKDYIAKGEERLAEIQGAKTDKVTKPTAKTPKKPEPEGTPEGFAPFEADAAKRGIKDTPEETYTKKVKETKKELDDVVKKYGEDSPRAKETKARLEDYEARLEDAKHEKETGQKTNNTGDAPPELLTADFTIDEPRTRLGKSWSAFYRVSVDSFADIEKAAKKIGGKQGQALLSQINAVRNSKNISASWISDRRSNWNRETVGKSLDKIFKQAGNGKKRQDFIDYCYHKHNLERLDVDKPISGMPREAEESLAAIKDLEAKYGNKIKDFQQEIVKYADDLLQYKVDAGIVSKTEADALRKYKNYIPTFTNKDFKGTINEDLSQGISVDRGLRRAVGGNEEDQLVDLYQQLAQSTRSTMKHTEMNEMIRMLGDLQGIKYSEIDKSVSPDQMLENSLFTDKSNGSYYATYYDADGAHTISIPEGMFKGIQEWTGEEKAILVNNGLVRGFGVPGRMFKNLVTGWNVIFGVRNGVRDLATALTYTKDLKGFAKSYPKAVKTVLTRKGPYWDAYIAAGGKYSSLAKSGGADGFMDALDSFKGSPLTWAKEINDTIETMPRMMEFISTVDKAGGINGAGREVINRAMRNANDVTLNFGRSGIAGRMMNSGFVPYLNPSIQGLDKLFRVFTEAKQEKNFRGLIGLGMKMSTFAIAPAVFNEYMLRDNEDYQQLNTRDKDSNYFIPLGDGKFIKIPKARELVVVAEPAQYFFRHAQFGDSGGWKQMFQSAVDNIGVVNPLTDNLVSPLYRVATNKTWFGGNIETAYEVDNLLPQDRYDEGTTLVAIDLAQKNPAKALGLSPKKIDNLIDSYTGVIGDFFIPMNSKASKGNPFVNKFITDSVFSNKLSTEAWDTYEKLKQESNSTTLDPKKVQDSKYKLQDFYNGYLGDTVTLNQAITDIQNNDKLSKAEKHDLVRQLKLSQNEIYRSSKDGSTPKLNGKEVDPLTAIFNLYNSRKDTKGKAVGITFKYAHKNYQESYEKYKGSEEYEKMTGKEKSRSRVKYLKYVTTIRDTRGKIGEEKDKFIDYKTVAVVGQMKNASESMMDSFGTGSQGLYKYLKENAKNYKDYKYDLKHFIATEKTVVDSSRKIGLDYRSQMQNHDVSMSLAHKLRDDGSYYIGDKKPEYQSTRMDPARYLVEKDKKQWSTKRIHDFADKHGYNYESDYDEVYKMAKKTYPDKSEKEWAAVAQVITGKGDNDFGDMSRKDDTGIMGDVGKDERDGGRGGRGRRGRGRGRGGRGGGGGGSGGSGATMPKTASGAIKGKVTNTYKSVISDKSIRSNLDDAYRKKAKKLREQSRKRK